MKDCYTVTDYTVSNLLSLIDHGDIAIPELQRPFVWDSTKVRDLVDSLYHGYPTGYLITWKNPDVKIKGGGNGRRQDRAHRRPAARHGAQGGARGPAHTRRRLRAQAHNHRVQPACTRR